jgi:hypothetical protein
MHGCKNSHVVRVKKKNLYYTAINLRQWFGCVPVCGPVTYLKFRSQVWHEAWAMQDDLLFCHVRVLRCLTFSFHFKHLVPLFKFLKRSNSGCIMSALFIWFGSQLSGNMGGNKTNFCSITPKHITQLKRNTDKQLMISAWVMCTCLKAQLTSLSQRQQTCIACAKWHKTTRTSAL